METTSPEVESLGIDILCFAERRSTLAAFSLLFNERAPEAYSRFPVHPVTSRLLQDGL
jgi:hypothetical protein